VKGLRGIVAAGAAGVVALSLGSAGPAGAVTGIIQQAAPAVVSSNDSVPGTSSNVTLVGHLAPGINVGDTTPAGQYSALAIAGNCAYIGRRSFNSAANPDNGLGVQTVDISNPAAPVYKGQVPGTVFADSTARELRAVEQYQLLIVMHYSEFTGGGVQEPLPAPVPPDTVDTGGHNVMQAFHINADCSTTHLADYNLGPVKPHEFYLWLDPYRPGRVIAYITTPFGPPDMAVMDFSSCSTVGGHVPTSCSPALLTFWSGGYVQPNPAAVANSGLGNYLHSLSVTPNGRVGYMAFWNGGFFTVDTSQIAADLPHPVIIGTALTGLRDDWSQHNGPTGQGGDAHSAVWVPKNSNRWAVQPYAILTDEDYLGVGDCPFGWLHIDRVQNIAGGVYQPVPVSSFGLPENTLKQEAAAVTFNSRANSLLSDPSTCAGYNQAHPGFIGASSAWPGGQIPANTYSSHNPTTFPDLVLLTWYGGGFRVVNIHEVVSQSGSRLPSESGFFVPTPEPAVNEEVDDPSGQLLGCYYNITPTATDPSNCTIRDSNLNSHNYVVHPQVEGWSYPIVKNGLIYFVDNRNGLYVVRYTGAFHGEVDSTPFAEGNSNNGSVPQSKQLPPTLPGLPVGLPLAAAHPAVTLPAHAQASLGGAVSGAAAQAASGVRLLAGRATTPPLGLPLALVGLLALGIGVLFRVLSPRRRA
jgi:hypothetical protein